MQPAEPSTNDTPGLRSITIGRDAVGNILVTGDGNEVSLTFVVADRRLLAELQPRAAAEPSPNPYRGLDAFSEIDAALFFGREKLIRHAWLLLQRLQRGSDPRILAVVGASGAGKSSLVRAGLLPELAREPIGLENSQVLVLRPGPAPLSRLADVLGRVSGTQLRDQSRLISPAETTNPEALHGFLKSASAASGSHFVVVIDQFEELFTECEDVAARTAFLQGLAFAAAHADGLVSVVLTLRSDFAGAVKEPAAFASAVRGNRLIVRAMDSKELRDAIARPAIDLGLPWPQAFVEDLVAQAEGRTGALPLVEFALKRLWQDHVSGRLDETHWSSRLIEDFLVQTADALFEMAGGSGEKWSRDQNIIRRAFVTMVQLGEGTPDTRRVARLSEFVANGEKSEHVRRVLVPFAAPEARLITLSEADGEPTYELTHEALIDSWDLFGAWLGKVPAKPESFRIRAELRLRRRLFNAAKEWKVGRGSLWSGPELDSLLTYVRHASDELSADELAFADASESERQRQLQREQQRLRWQTRIRWSRRLAISIAVMLAVLSPLIHYGLYRLSLQQSNGRDILVVKHGIGSVHPLLGSDQTVLELGYTFETSPKGRAVFLQKGSLLFPSFQTRRLFSWLTGYYLDRLEEAEHPNAPASEFFIEQLDVISERGGNALQRALSSPSFAAHEVIRLHHLRADRYKTVLLNNLTSPDADVVADSLNTLHELYSEDQDDRNRTKAALSLCDDRAVKVAIALSYEPDLETLVGCAERLISANMWKDSAALVIRFDLSEGSLLSRFKKALLATDELEFQSGADVVMGKKIDDLSVVGPLESRLADHNANIRSAAALALWSMSIDTPLVRGGVRELFSRSAGFPVYNLTLFRSNLTDPEVTRSLKLQLLTSSTGGPRVTPPSAVEILNKLSSVKSSVVNDLLVEFRAPKDEMRRAEAVASLVALGCRDSAVLAAINEYLRSGVPGIAGWTIVPEIAEAYGSNVLLNEDGNFDSGLDRLWALLQSERSESSADYRLAVEYAIAILVSKGMTTPEDEKRRSALIAKMEPWANDDAPHHRAAYVHTFKLISEKIDRKKRLLHTTQF